MGRTKKSSARERIRREEPEEEPPQEPPQEEPPREPTAEELERRRQEEEERAQQERERQEGRYQEALFRFMNWHRRYPREEMEVFEDNRLISPWLSSIENYRDLVSNDTSIEERYRILRRAEIRANNFSWSLMHPGRERRGNVADTVREYREHFVTNVNIVQAQPDEEQLSDSDISHYFEYLRDEEESDPEDDDNEDEDSQDSQDSQDSHRDRRILIRHPDIEDTDFSDNNDDESENNNSDPEDDDNEDEASQDSQRDRRRHPDIEDTDFSENDNENENGDDSV